MPTLGIRIVYAGNGSVVGHMYVVFKGEDGTITTFGHFPVTNLDGLGGAGAVRRDDDRRAHELQVGTPGTNGVPNVSKDFPISASAYEQALAYSNRAASQAGNPNQPWGVYSPTTNSCVDFAWNVMHEAGLNRSYWFEGVPLPSWNKSALDNAYFDDFRRPEFNIEGRRFDERVRERYVTATTTRPPVRRDPLAIDLDGDGIETVGAGSNPVLFDHNADGIRTGTGWVKGDDAWLVLDRNGNGLIDSGRELFGVDTVVSGTAGVEAVYAADGFEALRTLDSNGDKVFDSQDAAFLQVRLWQDLNQDGISQSTELFSLGQKGIVSIALNPTATSINLGNGNLVSGTAIVKRTGGGTTLAQAVGVSMDTTAANLNLTNNPFYRTFTDPIALTSAALPLPEMQGSGWVRDLRQAMSLGTPQGDALTAKVQAFVAATTRDAQMAVLDDLVRAWAATNQTRPLEQLDNARRRFVVAGDAVASARLQAAIPVLEVFNGATVQDSGMQSPIVSMDSMGQPLTTWQLLAQQAPLMLNAYELLRQSVYGALVLQTRLRPVLDSISLVIDAGGIRFNTSATSALLASRYASDAREAILDLVDLNRSAGSVMRSAQFDALGQLRDWVEALPANSALRSELANLSVFAGSAIASTSGDDVYLGDAAANTYAAGAGNDLVHGGAGDDILRGEDGNDLLRGGAGSDLLQGGLGDDVLDGDAGIDVLQGGLGNNIFLFGVGDGQDTISYLSDATAGKLNVLRFKTGVLPSQVVARRLYDGDFVRLDANNASYASLELSISGTTDKITVRGMFDYDNPANSYNPVQRIEFADGTVWGLAEIAARTQLGTAAADNLQIGRASCRERV